MSDEIPKPNLDRSYFVGIGRNSRILAQRKNISEEEVRKLIENGFVEMSDEEAIKRARAIKGTKALELHTKKQIFLTARQARREAIEFGFDPDQAKEWLLEDEKEKDEDRATSSRQASN